MTPGLSTLSRFSIEYLVFPSAPYSMSKQNTASESLLNLPTPPSNNILELLIFIDANLLNGIGIARSILVILFLDISYLSMLDNVPTSLLYPPKMKITLSSNKAAEL